MIHPDLDALLQGALDNTLTPEEQARLARMISESREARDRAAAFEQLAGLIESLGPADSARRAWSTTFSRKFRIAPMQFVPSTFERGVTVNKKILFGLAAAAAVVLAVDHLQQLPASHRGDGSDHRRRPARAGAPDRRAGREAWRHQRAGRAADRDLRRDHEGRDAAHDAAGRRGARSCCRTPSCGTLCRTTPSDVALNDPTFRQKISDPALHRALDDPAAAKKFDDANMRALLSNRAFADALRDNENSATCCRETAWRRRWPARHSSSALRDNGFDAAMRSQAFAASLKTRH